MHSTFDERVWLDWLVKVRVLILTFLLGIELAIARFTATPLPARFFINAMLLWYALALFHIMLHSLWRESRAQSLLQVLSDMAMVTLVVHITGGVSDHC